MTATSTKDILNKLNALVFEQDDKASVGATCDPKKMRSVSSDLEMEYILATCLSPSKLEKSPK